MRLLFLKGTNPLRVLFTRELGGGMIGRDQHSNRGGSWAQRAAIAAATGGQVSPPASPLKRGMRPPQQPREGRSFEQTRGGTAPSSAAPLLPSATGTSVGAAVSLQRPSAGGRPVPAAPPQPAASSNARGSGAPALSMSPRTAPSLPPSPRVQGRGWKHHIGGGSSAAEEQPCPCDPTPLGWIDAYVTVHLVIVVVGLFALLRGFPTWPFLATLAAATWLVSVPFATVDVVSCRLGSRRDPECPLAQIASLTAFGLMLDGPTGIWAEAVRLLLAAGCVHRFPEALLQPVAASVALPLVSAKRLATGIILVSLVATPALAAVQRRKKAGTTTTATSKDA